MVLTGQSAFSYKKKNWQSLCFQFLLFKKCACFDSFLECPICGLPKENVDICKNQDQLDCLDSFSDEENYLLCDKMCQQECEFQNFEKDALTNSIVDFTKFLNVQSNLVNLVANVDNVESIALSLKIYFDDFFYREISESPSISEFTLLASIGGTVSLFIGISFMTIFEVIDTMVQIVYYLVENKAQKKPKNWNYRLFNSISLFYFKQ